MEIRKKYIYFLSFVLLFTVVLGTKFVSSQKPSFEIAPSPGPTIQNTSVSPALGLLGTIFTITTQASDVSGISSVIAHIQNPDETNVAQVTLYDDGMHNDGAANDGTYGASWNSTGFPGATYFIDIIANDTLGYFAEDENGASFDIVTNFPPTADARVGSTPNPTGKRVSVVAGDTVYFDGSTYSSDLDGTITKYEWDFENDGTYDWSSSTTGKTTHVYTTGSGYVAKLRVTDNKGATATDTVSIDRVLGCACEAWTDGSCGGGIFNDNFEIYSLGNLKGQGGWDTIYPICYNRWQVVDTRKYDGNKSAYLDDYDEGCDIKKFSSGKSSGIHSHYVNFSGQRTGADNFIWFELIGNDPYNSALGWYGIWYTFGRWAFYYYKPGVGNIISNPDVSINVWHSIEAQFDEPNWRYKLKLDGGSWSDWINFVPWVDPKNVSAIVGFNMVSEGAEVWIDAIDGEVIPGPCLATQMSRTRTCKPTGCAIEFDCNGNAATCGGFFPPPKFDWSHKVLPGAPPPGGADWMSPVKNQGTWDVSALFASIGVMEGKYNIQNNNPNLDTDLSEQYMDACLQTSLLENILRYTGGPTDEACLPYKTKSVLCLERCSNWNTRLWDLTGVITTNGNRDEIKYALINYGPLRVTMDMANWNPITYSCGSDPSVNHAAVIVGYDDAEGVWIVRNSWGSSWNGTGYFKVKYGKCLIDDEAVAIDRIIAP